MSEFSIKVTIAGRSYPLTIEREEEENVRRAAKNINEYIKELQDNYAVNDKQDLLAMAALQMSTQVTSGTAEVENEGFKLQLQALEEKLDAYLKS